MIESARAELMSVVRARTENQSWQQFYSDLLSHHGLDTSLLTLARLRQQKEGKLKLKETKTDEESLAEELFQQILEMFQLRSHEAAMVTVSLTDINNGDSLMRQTLQNVSHCFHQTGSQQDEKCQFIKLFGILNILPRTILIHLL